MSVTLSDLKTRIKDLVDGDSADQVTDVELVRYINEAIKECEAQIHLLNEDYYKKDAYLSISSGTSEYSLPSDIYAQKIRRIMFDSSSSSVTSSNRYEVMSIKDEEVPFVETGDLYRYRLIFNSSDAKVIKLYPTPNFTDSAVVKISYIKNAKQLSSDSDVLDIPEFEQFIIDFARYRVLQKEVGNPMIQTVGADLDRTREIMVATLQESVPDGNNEVELNTDMYSDYYDLTCGNFVD